MFYIFKVLILVRPESFMRDTILIQGKQVALWWLIFSRCSTLISFLTHFHPRLIKFNSLEIWYSPTIVHFLSAGLLLINNTNVNFLWKQISHSIRSASHQADIFLRGLFSGSSSSSGLPRISLKKNQVKKIRGVSSPEMLCLEIKLPRLLPIIASSVQHHALLDQQRVVIGCPEEKNDNPFAPKYSGYCLFRTQISDRWLPDADFLESRCDSWSMPGLRKKATLVMRRCIQKSNRTFSGKAQARLTFKIDAIRWIAGHLWEEHNDPDPSVVKTQPGAVGRTGRAFKEGVHGKGGGADHEEDENARIRMKMRKSNRLIKLSSNFSEMIFSYLQGSWALWVQRGVMIARQSGLTRVRGREKQAFWMLHLVVSDGGKG